MIFWRRFFRIFPSQRDRFLQMLAEGQHRMGATAFLRRTLLDHGWKCLNGGLIQHERGWKVNWTSCSKFVLRKMLGYSWSAIVCQHAQHRKDFDIEGVDVLAFHASLGSLNDIARSHAMNLVVGKHVTNEALVHYSKGAASDKCPLCGERDGRKYRVWECAMTEQFRQSHSKLMQWLEHQEDAVSSWGLLPLDFSWIDWRFHGDPTLPIVTCSVACSDDVAHVFTDGSAVGQNITGLTIAAAAYVHCRDYLILSSRAEPVPGNDHTSYRGEIWAVIMALRDFRRVYVYSDCAAVVPNLLTAISAKQSGSKPQFTDHEDLWGIVWDLVLNRAGDEVLVTKVKAHLDISTISDPFYRWLSFMNDKADALARRCLQKTWKGVGKANQLKVCTEIQRYCHAQGISCYVVRNEWGSHSSCSLQRQRCWNSWASFPVVVWCHPGCSNSLLCVRGRHQQMQVHATICQSGL